GAACSPGEILDVRDLEPLALALAPDGTRLAVAGPAGPVELWDLASAKRIDTVEGTESLPREVAYAPAGTLLIGTGTALEHTASDPEHAPLFASGPAGDRCRPRRRRPGRRARRRDLLDGLPGAALGPGTGRSRGAAPRPGGRGRADVLPRWHRAVRSIQLGGRDHLGRHRLDDLRPALTRVAADTTDHQLEETAQWISPTSWRPTSWTRRPLTATRCARR